MKSAQFHYFVRPIRRGFTVVELLVAVSVMTLIVLVLYGLFDQVQRALRSNSSQVDVLEGGRASNELMAREMEQMQAGNVLSNQNLFIGLTSLPYHLALLDPNVYHTNVLQEVFFLSKYNKRWTGTGYRILSFSTNGIANQLAGGVGTLSRYSVDVSASDFPNINLFSRVMNTDTNTLAKFQRIADGVIHFRLRAFDTNGMLMVSNIYPDVRIVTNTVFLTQPTSETRYAFTNSALPACLELEMGILEPHVWERYKSIPNAAAASNYLARQVGAVHLFQERIPIHMAK